MNPGTATPAVPASNPKDFDPQTLRSRHQTVREFTESLVRPLAAEDCAIQSMPDVSPSKWHLAHTTWFFETFILKPAHAGHREFHPMYNYLFNSYYNAVGERHARPRRGLLSRPSIQEVFDYREYTDNALTQWLEGVDAAGLAKWAPILELGLHHEQQHQELILTDIKHVFSVNPLYPVYLEQSVPAAEPAPLAWIDLPEGAVEIGHAGGGFCFDNETPRHKVWLQPARIASRCATNGEYMEFIADGGYRRHELWLSEGWDRVQQEGWTCPLYWQERNGTWWNFTLSGLRRVEPSEPVTHLSYFEADAFARWSGARLPLEAEWETAAEAVSMEGNFADGRAFHPVPTPAGESGKPAGMMGDVWEWTSSSYSPYPGYRPDAGALGEYNGKWMCNQYVLRGGSCATPRSHIRKTYRNFFPAGARWQFAGVRLAKDR